MADLLAAHDARFRGLRIERAHLCRSLAYFEDAEAEPMPRLPRPWRREEIRAFFERFVREALA
ncbi:MAG: hypothetical protein KatS3mg014_2679 [Actinomycetota bacterium]|nr:MAG: hypothetical protein KatS3mg014_2679 [Actinomycetota bacterium]